MATFTETVVLMSRLDSMLNVNTLGQIQQNCTEKEILLCVKQKTMERISLVFKQKTFPRPNQYYKFCITQLFTRLDLCILLSQFTSLVDIFASGYSTSFCCSELQPKVSYCWDLFSPGKRTDFVVNG